MTKNISGVLSPLSDKPSKLVEMLAVDKIVSLYKRNLGIDVSRHFGGVNEIGLYKCNESGLLFFFPMMPGDGKFYEDLQKNSWYYQSDKSEWRFAQNYTKEKNILEIGCGIGRFSEYAKAAHYAGLELNGNAVRIARENGLNVINQLSSEHVIEVGGYYDVVCSFQVLEHVTDVKGFMADAVKLCRSGGLIVLSVPNDDGFVGLACDNYLNMPPHHLTRWPRKSLQYLSDVFKIEMIELHEEEFDLIHSEWYARILVGYLLRALVNRPVAPLVSGGIADRIIDNLGRSVCKKLAEGPCFDRLFPKGFSVTAVYKKP